jgi:hypothetical protein
MLKERVDGGRRSAGTGEVGEAELLLALKLRFTLLKSQLLVSYKPSKIESQKTNTNLCGVGRRNSALLLVTVLLRKTLLAIATVLLDVITPVVVCKLLFI